MTTNNAGFPALKPIPQAVSDHGVHLGDSAITGRFPRRAKLIAATVALLVLAGCSAAQLQSVSTTAASIQPGLQAACNDALAIANIAGLVPGVGAIVPYLNAGCATAEGITKLAADPSSTEWVGTLAGQIKALASAAGLRISDADIKRHA